MAQLILGQHPEATAAATVNEAALPGVQRALHRAGLAVPADFSLIGVAAQHWPRSSTRPSPPPTCPPPRWAHTRWTCSPSASPTPPRCPSTCSSPLPSHCATASRVPRPAPRRRRNLKARQGMLQCWWAAAVAGPRVEPGTVSGVVAVDPPCCRRSRRRATPAPGGRDGGPGGGHRDDQRRGEQQRCRRHEERSSVSVASGHWLYFGTSRPVWGAPGPGGRPHRYG